MVKVIDNSRRRPGIAGRRMSHKKSDDVYYRAQSGGIIYEDNADTSAQHSTSLDGVRESNPPSNNISFDELSVVAATTKMPPNETTTSICSVETCPPLTEDEKKIEKETVMTNQVQQLTSGKHLDDNVSTQRVADSDERRSASTTKTPSRYSTLSKNSASFIPSDSGQSQSLPPTLEAGKVFEPNIQTELLSVDDNCSITDISESLSNMSEKVAALLAENESLKQAALRHADEINATNRTHQQTIDSLRQELQLEFDRKIEEMQQKYSNEVAELKTQNERNLLEARRTPIESAKSRGTGQAQDLLVLPPDVSETLLQRADKTVTKWDDTMLPVRQSLRKDSIPLRRVVTRGATRSLFKEKQTSPVKRSARLLANDALMASKRSAETAFLTYGGTPLVSCKRVCPGLQYVVRSPSFSSDESKE